MMKFCELSFFLRSMFGLWVFLLCGASITGVILSFAFKRHNFAFPSIATFIPAYYFWQVIFNIYRFWGTDQIADVSVKLGSLSWMYWFFAFVLLTMLTILPIFFIIRYSRNAITPFAIKRCADRMNCGICYWLDNGHVVFSNICMNQLCIALTDEQLLNGNRLRDGVSDGIQSVGEKVWNFTSRELELGGEHLHELVAWDVSELYEKTQVLKRKNEDMTRYTSDLKAYSLKIDEIVRRQEMLKAKINIHDEMNRLMLSTVAADRNDTDVLDRIFNQWNRNALLLCMEAEAKTEQNAAYKLDRLAEVLGLHLVWNGEVPEALIEKQKNLFFTAAQEAIVNAVKHGQAKRLEISYKKTGAVFCCIFENDGNIPKENIRFTGGLANLSLLAKEQRAAVSVETGKTFKLFLRFPQKNPK